MATHLDWEKHMFEYVLDSEPSQNMVSSQRRAALGKKVQKQHVYIRSSWQNISLPKFPQIITEDYGTCAHKYLKFTKVFCSD